MIDMSKPIAFTDLRKRQNIRRNNEYLHDKKYIQGYHEPLRIFCYIYGEVFASDVIRPFRLQLIQR